MKPLDYRGGWPWLVLAALMAVGLVAWASHSVRRPSVAAQVPESAQSSIAAQPAAPMAAVPSPVLAARPARPAPPARATAQASGSRPRVAHAEPSAPHGTAGMVVGIDPETGQLGAPTPEQLSDLRRLAGESVSKTSEGLTEIHLADGTVIATLDGRFEEYLLLSIGPDGKPKYGCIHGDGHAQKTVASTLPVGGLEEK